MKIKTSNLKACLFLVLFVTQSSMAADLEPRCENQFLKSQGAIPKTLVPGQTATIVFVSSSGQREAELALSARQMNKQLLIEGKITNIGQCIISTLQPVKLYPIRNGLPLGWHSLPDGMSNSRLQSGEYLSFNKQYSKAYLGGFNLSMGSWNLEAPEKQEEVKKDESTKPTEAKKNVPLSDAEKLFADALENDDLTETNQRLNDSFARAQRESAESENFRNTMQQSIQTLQTLQMQQLLIEQQKQIDQQRANNQQRALENQKAQTKQGAYSSNGQRDYKYQEPPQTPQTPTYSGPCKRIGDNQWTPSCMK